MRRKDGKVKTRRKLDRLWVGRALAYTSLGLLGILMLSMLFPVTGSSSSALSNTDTAATTRVSVKAVETVSIRLASKVGLELTPSSQGSFGVAETELGVTTNDPEGYEVFLASTDHEAALRGASNKISTIEQDTMGSSFTGNTWGYSIGKEAVSATSTYSTVPTTTSSILKTETASIDTEEVYHLGFGVHITPSLPAGEYSSSVLLSVVANPATISSLSDLVYMQDITSDICSNTYPTETDLTTMTEAEKTEAKLHPVTKRLYDVRDGKQYWVAKLADGNCWMTQNLALDLDVNSDGNAVAVSKKGNQVELNPNNTDITDVWKGATKTETEIPEKDDRELAELASEVRSWDLGEIVMIDRAFGITCGSISSSDDIIKMCSQYLGDFSSLPETERDEHDLLGNYYSWTAAVASTWTDEEVNADGSICPNNWMLPVTGGNQTVGPYDLEKSIYQLLRAYGYPETGKLGTDPVGEWYTNGSNVFTRIGVDGAANIADEPIYLLRSGSIMLTAGVLTRVGQFGTYWTATGGAVRASTLDMDLNVAPFNPYERIFGAQVRCLAR